MIRAGPKDVWLSRYATSKRRHKNPSRVTRTRGSVAAGCQLRIFIGSKSPSFLLDEHSIAGIAGFVNRRTAGSDGHTRFGSAGRDIFIGGAEAGVAV